MKKLLTLCLIFIISFNCYAAKRDYSERFYRVYYIACLDGYGNYDTNILCAIHEQTGEIRLVSMLRDLDIDGKRLNAYSSKTIEFMKDLLNTKFDTKITKYISMNWRDAISVLNEFDPIEVTLSESERYYLNAYIHNTCEITGISKNNPADMYVDVASYKVQLKGLQLVAYCRLRYGSSDYTRTSNQRAIVTNLIEQLQNKNILELGMLYTKYSSLLKTDVGLKDYIHLSKNIGNYYVGASNSFPDRKMVDSIQYRLVPLDIKKCNNDLHRKLFNNPFYDYVKNTQ